MQIRLRQACRMHTRQQGQCLCQQGCRPGDVCRCPAVRGRIPKTAEVFRCREPLAHHRIGAAAYRPGRQ